MKRLGLALAAAGLIFACVSCGKIGGGNGNNPYKELKLTTKSSEFLQKSNDFTFEFIRRVDAVAEKDYIISPLSLQFLLGMILDGARGETADEICDVLGYGAGETEAVNEYALSLLRQLPSLDKKTKLAIANAIFVDDGWPLLDSYKSDVGKFYDAEVSNLDFLNGPASLKAINGWCSDHTNKLIPKILDQVDPNILAYLLNAIYFKSEWKDKFQKSVTSEEDFTSETGTKGKVAMMKQDKEHQYVENEVFQAVKLNYGNGAFSMVALLPKAGHKVSEIPDYLAKGDWQTFLRKMSTHPVDLWLPKFETKYNIQLKEILSDMGMPRAFDENMADFKAMSDYALCLSFVKQDALIKVDEEGTEAAVVSIGGMAKENAAAPNEPVVFHADHPFLYLITESSTGAVLFAGRYSGK